MSIIKLVCAVIATATLLSSVNAKAQEVVGVEQPVIEPNTGFVIGGRDRIEIWQTFAIGRLGVMNDLPPVLSAIELAIFCPDSIPLIEIYEGSPLDPERVSYVEIDRSNIRDPFGNLKRFELSTPFEYDLARSYAIRISLENSTPGKICTIQGGTFNNSDPNVTLLVRDSSQTIWDNFYDFFDRRDIEMAYRALVRDPIQPQPGLCEIANGSNPDVEPAEIPEDIPVCRCFEDPFLFELRCATITSDFFLLQRSPWPLQPGQAYEETWEFTPITPLKAPVTISVDGSGISPPITKQFKPGSSKLSTERLSIKRVAGKDLSPKMGSASITYQDASQSEKVLTIVPPKSANDLKRLQAPDTQATSHSLRKETTQK